MTTPERGAHARRARSGVGALILALCAIYANGCAEDEASCSELVRPCDISETSCQREIFAATACVRGQRGARMPPIRGLTRAQFADELREAAAGEDDFGTLAWSAALSLMGLIPREQSAEEASIMESVTSVAAYYARDTKQVTVIVDRELDSARATSVLSHEFVHALQDQRENLDSFYEQYADTSDANAALKSLTEGEAVLISNLVSAARSGADPDDLDWESYFGDWRAEVLDEVADASAPLFAARSLVYPVGGFGVVRSYRRAGASGVRAFYADPPLTFRNWADFNRGARTPVVLECATPEPPAGFERRFVDRQGMIGLLSLYAALDFGGAYDAAQAWVSDAFTVYTPVGEDASDVAVAWRIRFESGAKAERLISLVAQRAGWLSVRRVDADVLVAAASTEQLLADWSPDGRCFPADESRVARDFGHRMPRRASRWVDLQHAHVLGRR